MIKRSDKRGQFYLLAAVIIIAGIMGFAAVGNSAQRNTEITIEDIEEELGIESGEVLDHGTFRELASNDMTNLINNFTRSYVGYVGEDTDIYFIYGDEKEVSVSSYEETTTGSMSVDIGSGIAIPGTTIETEVHDMRNFVPGQEKKVSVEISGVSYDFDLAPGRNFYFIVSKQIGDERHVVTNEDDD
jgi:hypothetical protein